MHVTAGGENKAMIMLRRLARIVIEAMKFYIMKLTATEEIISLYELGYIACGIIAIISLALY